jgi:cytidylate kinase
MREGHAVAVVTISRHFGAGGHTLGQRLCERFGFRLADASVVDRLARNEKLSPDWLNAMEKEASSTILSMISTLVSGGIFYKHPGSPAEKDDRQKYLAFLTQIFTAMANEGGYVIVGRGAQFVLKGHPKAIHVLLVADYESRVSFLMGQHKISRSDAEKTIRAREKERTALASRLFKTDIDDPSLYQIVLNTGMMPYDWVVDTVSELVTRFMGRE